jgi:hypothetical protein
MFKTPKYINISKTESIPNKSEVILSNKSEVINKHATFYAPSGAN